MRSISLLVNDNLASPLSGAAAAKGSQRATKAQCSRGEKCGMKRDPENKLESKGKLEGSRSSSLRRRPLKQGGTPTGKSLSDA